MTAEPPPGSPAPPAPALPDGARRPALRRSPTDRVVAGVCGGLAEHTGVEALLWRVGFIALALMGPGIPVYLLLWALVPGGPTAAGDPDVPVSGSFADRLRTGMTPSR